jgi:glycosyltransferase involved in cell wall biosynthesis
MSPRRKLLFLVAEDWFFCSHFIERAQAASEAGYEVLVLTRVREHGAQISAAGLRLVPLSIERGSVNPLSALRTLGQIVAVYRAERPDLVHHVALKPILLGTLAARLAGVHRIVNAVVGLGYVFTSQQGLARALRPVLNLALKLLLNPRGSRVVFENADDLGAMVRSGHVRADEAVLIRGAGVDPARFTPTAGNPVPVVVLVARMLWDKGVGEFVQAAAALRAQGARADFVLVGDADPANRAAIPQTTMQHWQRQGDVQWWGFRRDMPALLAQADIACLPSYREGLPKSLLEAMAAGLPCVTTDVPGCREAVRHGDNGLLVPPRDAAALGEALRRLLDDERLRKRMGARGRERLETEFSTGQVVNQTLTLYRALLG